MAAPISIFRTIPIVILSTSSSIEDIRESYRRSANCYVTKPSDFDRYVEVIHRLQRFWLGTVERPGSGSA